jgi:hypothetical protein
MTTIKATIAAAFALATDAAKTRDAIAKLLPTLTPREHAVAHRAYTCLNDLVCGFGHLQDKINAGDRSILP